MKIKILVGLLLFSYTISLAQENISFKIKIQSYLVDTTNFWNEYPIPPEIPEFLMNKCEKEFHDDSLSYFFEKLKKNSYKGEIQEVQNYLLKKSYAFSYLLLLCHWNPDVRVNSIKQLNERFRVRLLINSVKAKNGVQKQEDQLAVRFLLYLLEKTPLFIVGSENATIHDIYIDNICWYLDKLTKQNNTKSYSIGQWYKNEDNYKKVLSNWRAYLNS